MPERRRSDFLASLFDDITTTRVIAEMNLDQATSPTKRRGSPEGARPLKKIRLDASSSSPKSPSLSYMPRHNLAELSFPPLPFEERAREAGKNPSVQVPLPAVALTKRRLTMRPSWEIGMVDNSAFSNFILPSNQNKTDSPCPLKPSLSQASSKEELPESRSESPAFGWFVD